jgi:tetratricopeptide (TPR) repeat protein
MSPAPPKRPSSPGSAPPRRPTRSRPAATAPAEEEFATVDQGAEEGGGEEGDSGGTMRNLEAVDEDPGEMTNPGASQGAQGANATVIYDTRNLPPRAAGPTAKLIVLKGPKQGAEFNLGAGETSIGRNAENTVVIPDISVSRKHVVLVKDGPNYILQDQGSGNGTLVNGASVGEHKLKDGDVFSIGDTEIQFAVMGGGGAPRRATGGVHAQQPGRPSRANNPAVPHRPGRPAPQPIGEDDLQPEVTGQVKVPGEGGKKPKSKAPLFVAGGLVVVMLAVGIAYKRHQQALIDAEEDEKAHAVELQMADANGKLKQGKELVVKGQWDKALVLFNEAKALGLQDDDLTNYLDHAQKEVANQKLFEDATAAVGQGNLASAMDLINKVPSDSTLFENVDDAKKKIKAAVPGRISEARNKFAAKDFAKAHAILDDVAKIDPSNSDLATAQEDLDKAEHPGAKPIKIDRKVQSTDHSQDVIAAFKSGDLKAAKDLAAQFGQTDDNIRKLGEKVAEFESAWGKIDSDAASFQKARDLDRSISGGHSTFTAKLNTQALATYMKACLQAKSAGDLGKAYSNCEKAHDADPNNADANNVLTDLKNKAKDMYMQGYVIKGDNPTDAHKIFQQVISITPSDDEYHQKAQARLKEMGNN